MRDRDPFQEMEISLIALKVVGWGAVGLLE